MRQLSRQIHNHLSTAKKVLIVPHQNPDADAIGSAVAIAEYLADLGQNPRLFCATSIQKKPTFLPGLERLVVEESAFDDADTIIVVDSGDLKYAGIDGLTENHPAIIINIDHHQTNEKYGKYNLVMPEASATAEVLYYFFKHNNLKINSRMATALLSGIVTDTNNFSNPGTTTSSLLVAGELLRHGGNMNLIQTSITKNKTINILKLWGDVLSRLQKNEKKDIAHTYITRADYEKYLADENEVEGIANFLNNLYGAKISLLLRETADGKVKGSLRTTADDADVSTIAKKMGGGGHKKAAGFTVEGTIQNALDLILKME